MIDKYISINLVNDFLKTDFKMVGQDDNLAPDILGIYPETLLKNLRFAIGVNLGWLMMILLRIDDWHKHKENGVTRKILKVRTITIALKRGQ